MDYIYVYTIVIIVVALVLGYVLAYLSFKSKIGNADIISKKLIDDAKRDVDALKKDFEVERLKEENALKDEFNKKRSKLESEIDTQKNRNHKKELQLKDFENQLKSKEGQLKKHEREIRSKEQSFKDKERYLEVKTNEIEKNLSKSIESLEKISGMSQEEALEYLKSKLINKAKDSAAQTIKEIKDQAKETGDKEAKEIVVSAIQRTAADHSADTTVSVINLPNDDIKGRIIGREGRNIRSFEQATGIELIVDDTPGAVVISGFDPFRRSIAKNALEALIEDGRIHPGKIEEVVERAKKDMDQHIKELGQDTIIDLNLKKAHPEMLKLLGRLHYRTSYGQNVLLHSIECAKLCALMAAELGYDTKEAARAGLFHDIGKAVDQYQEGTHVELGLELAKKYKESKYVLNAIASHHEDYPIAHPISSLVMAADAISSSRPGARRETLGNYLQRIEKLENVALEYEGVTKAFAIHAGREIRVLVENDSVNDARADLLASEIAEKIENEMQYPGHIKVTVIREYRAQGVAK
ncbi:MAG: ribonuclease Y [Candidatus Cloacimonadota bacterium]|nr:MAG: ribonuclease Y [Candidatus Cloacimonadota bacterium]PIE78693.1 MAG: ribonuclease Y [Candidatus Delongbacteria bacterium]